MQLLHLFVQLTDDLGFFVQQRFVVLEVIIAVGRCVLRRLVQRLFQLQAQRPQLGVLLAQPLQFLQLLWRRRRRRDGRIIVSLVQGTVRRSAVR